MTVDLAALRRRAEQNLTESWTIDFEIDAETVLALIQAVEAAQTIAGFGWDSPHQPKRQAALLALDAALAPFTETDP